MSEQRQHGARQSGLIPHPEAADDTTAAERLAAARGSLDRVFAAAGPILEEIQRSDNEQRLQQMRQSGGQ